MANRSILEYYFSTFKGSIIVDYGKAWSMIGNPIEKKNTLEIKEALTRNFYYVFQCAQSTELRGRKYVGGCGKWNVRKSKIALIKVRQMQGNCKFCARRPRINPRAVTTFFDADTAKEEANARNGVF